MVLGVLASCRALGVEPIAAGVESEAEVTWLRQTGVERFQGYFFGRPAMIEEEEEESDFFRGLDLSPELSACAA
jgi:EAL domain-containing protein (putative c-di-GMP-specific phosphodiesterase class I)